ncbi:hypothetical protein BDW22DRAFT_1388046 [Trametopsis cervina]|nr:hypothetical protein BDW22DRAFT_1388046 [Trametopsis cervina]
MAAVTARASFIVFKDEPSPSPKEAAKLEATVSASSVLAIVTAKDKENLHPLTGRKSQNEDTSLKKSKTSALATKLLVASGKALPEPHASPKKRRLSTSSDTSRPSVKREAKKEKRASSLPRKLGAKPSGRTRRTIDLPKVEEEDALEAEKVADEKASREEEEATQAIVDSKCYDLTVLPLADVSQAFEQAPPLETSVEVEKEAVHDAETATDSQTPQDVPEPCLTRTPTKPKSDTFSTPERKRLYSAFTFQSPSPAAKRYALSRGSSVDRFSDVEFDPTSSILSFRAS